MFDMCHLTGVTCPARRSQHVVHSKQHQLVIDSTIFGNESRFIRRTRDADSVNCALVEKFIGEEFHVIVASTCHIEADTPLYLHEKEFERNKYRQSHGRALLDMAELREELQSMLLDLEKFRASSEPNIDTEELIIEDETSPQLGVTPVTQSATDQVTPVKVDPELELTLGYLARDPFQRLKELTEQAGGDPLTGVKDPLAANVDHVPLNTNLQLQTELRQWQRTHELHLAARSRVHLPYLADYHTLAEQFSHVPVLGARTTLGLIALLKNHVTTMFRFNGGTCHTSFTDAEQLITCLDQDLRCPYCHAGHSQPLCDTCQALRAHSSEPHFDRYAVMKQSIFANLRAKLGSEWLQEFIVKEIPSKQPLPATLQALELWHVEHFDMQSLSRALMALTALRVLRLDGARVHWSTALSTLPLWELRIKHCKNLSPDDLQHIGGMTSLRCLDLTNSAMHVTHAFSELRELKELQHLTLDDTAVSDAGLLPLLLTLPLIELSLQHCAALHLTTLVELCHVTSLHALRLAQCHLNTPLVTLMLTRLTHLTYLDMMHVNLKVTPSLVDVLLSNSTPVKHVDLRGCAISAEHRAVLAKMSLTLREEHGREILF